DLGRRLGGELDELVADLDLGGRELADGRSVRIADGPVGVRDGLDHAVGALGGFTAVVGREVAVDLGVPGLLCRGAEGTGDVPGGARSFGPVDGGAFELGQIGIRIAGLDRLVVPVRDLALEVLRARVGGEVELVDSLDVEGHGDRGDVDGEFE